MQFPLFETLCIEQGDVKNIALHQQRYERSVAEFFASSAVKIQDLLGLIQQQPMPSDPLIRCKISYNAQDAKVEFFPYQRRYYRHFSPVICDEIDYHLKFQQRDLLNRLLSQKGEADEIMIIKQGLVTDCSIGNLVFRQGSLWFTPDTPLLEGTQRQLLLQQGKIQQCRIFAEDVPYFDEIRLINAMNPLKD